MKFGYGFGFFIYFVSLASIASDLEVSKKNIEGQKNLYKKGWFIIASPVEAWDFARENSERSKDAFARALAKIETNQKSFKDRLESSKVTYKAFAKTGDKVSINSSDLAAKISVEAFADSKKNFKESWQKLNMGYVQYRQNNQEDLEALKEINTKFFKRVGEGMKEYKEASDPILMDLLYKSEIQWSKNFKEGKYQFGEQYKKSGTRGNSLSGLWDVLVGYASWTYVSLVKPGSRAVYQEAKSVPYYTLDLVAKTFIASFNVVHSLGANLYYSTKLGYKVISPALESGYLASLALLQVTHSQVSSRGLETFGLINKFAIKGTAPMAAGSQLVIEEVADRAVQSATFIVHGSEAAGEILFEKIESGVALGYSSLSQIPPQLLLTTANSVIFLVYDGPKLVLSKVTGKIGDLDIQEVPVGSVMDMKKMKEEGLKVETVTEDPETIKKVLEHVE